MAFDVYVGTMTRFYRRDWENAAQRMARAQGIEYRMIYAGGDPEPPPPADVLRQSVSNWRQGLSAALEPHGVEPLSWNEGDEQPYFTDRPAWEGYSALLVWAAHAEHPDLPPPDEVPEAWVEDPAYQRSTVREFKSRFRSILEPQLWLPAKFPFIFNGPTLVADNDCIGSVFTLAEQLQQLHSDTLGQLQELKKRETSNPDETLDKRPPLASCAEFGLQIFRELAARAVENRLPILLSF